MFDKIIQFIKSLHTPIPLEQVIVILLASLVASIIVYLMYQFFYGSRYIGAGVHRTFILGGPAITALFMGIQVSIPLSLGLLGALSFVRFRTPVKDPAEIGFILLLIACSIGIATSNYLLTGILIVLVFLCLSIQWLARNRLTLFGRGNLMISLDQSAFPGLEEKLNNFLRQRLPGVRLDSMSVLDSRVTLNYLYRRRTGFDWTAFTNDLMKLAGRAKVEVFVG